MLFETSLPRTALAVAAASLIAAFGLAACSSVSLEPLSKGMEPFRPVPAAPPASAPAPAEEPASSPAAVPQPITADGAAPNAADGAASSVPETIESIEVAARFPDPATRYDTPGLQPDRKEWTTQAELQGILQSLADLPMAADGYRPQLLSIGSTQEGTPLQALRLARPTTDGSVKPVVVLIGEQHGDEPASAEALIVIARDLAKGKLTELLNRIDVIIVPRANPDGAARGQALNANGVDINRDHLLLKTPEAQALAQLVRDYQPMVIVDAHEYTVGGRFIEKFGATQRSDALLQYAMTPNLPDFITKASEEWFRRPLLNALKREQLTSEWYYTTSADMNDNLVSMGGVQADSGRNVNGLKNIVSLLVETRGAGIGHQHIQRRVHTQVTAIRNVLSSTASRAADLQKLRGFVEADTRSKACQGDVTIDAGQTRSEYNLVMLDPTTGVDKNVSVDWNSSLFLQANRTRARPCGYWLAADASDAVQHLRWLGVQVMQLSSTANFVADNYREAARTTPAKSNPAAADFSLVKVELVNALIEMPAGSYYVPLTQPLANLVIAALEPDSQSGYLANGLISGLDRVARLRVVPDVAVLAPLP